MGYQWELDAGELFGDRHLQMVAGGLPAEDVEGVRGAVRDMWADRPGGWVHEWSRLGERYAGEGEHGLAALAYGWAKFPCLADEAKRAAHGHQLEQYQLAAPGFGVDFQRDVLDLAHGDGTTKVPVHHLVPGGLADDAPVLLASGGVDTWKMDMHGLFVVAAKQLGAQVVAFDIAGTGESEVPMTPDGGGEIVRGLIAHARTLTTGPVAHLGISMGGHFAARSGLAGEVDAAVDFGGPVEAAFAHLAGGSGGSGAAGPLPGGMEGIFGNALGFDRPPTPEEAGERLRAFSLRQLLDQDANAPMLVVNGADDPLVPQRDTLVFQGRRATEVHLLPDAGHCGKGKFPEAGRIILTWLKAALDR